YRQLSTRLAGGEEYAAMEMLHLLYEANQYDLLVLDTPPAANALEFLDAPQKMVNLLESPAVNLFISIHKQSGRFSFKLLSFGAAFVFKRIARFVGGNFLDDVAKFFFDFSNLLEGFAQRATRVVELLSQKDTGFVIVTSPDPRAIDEAIDFRAQLVERDMHPAAFVINRVHKMDTAIQLTEEKTAQLLAAAGLDPKICSRLSPVLLSAQERIGILVANDADQIQRLRENCGNSYQYVQIPFFDHDIHDISGLTKIIDALGLAQ
ncbi:MAG: ArsA-related P-loop ATPase, partial [Pseudomonadota bacterium]